MTSHPAPSVGSPDGSSLLLSWNGNVPASIEPWGCGCRHVRRAFAAGTEVETAVRVAGAGGQAQPRGADDRFQFRFARSFREYGLAPSQYNVLHILRGEGEPLPVLEVVGRMVAAVAGITVLIENIQRPDIELRNARNRDVLKMRSIRR